MPDEALISEIENLLAEVVELGGQNERSQIVPNLTVQDANPTNLDGFVIVSDDRDGDNILAKKVGSVIYADNDLVNLMFLKGGEAIAFQQGSESSNSGIWEIVPSTTTDIFYDKGDVGIGKSVAPDAALEILDASQAQLRLTHTEDTDFVDFQIDTNADLTVTPSGTGQVIFQPTTDSVDFFQVLDADGGNPVLNVDSTNERIGVGTAAPNRMILAEKSSNSASVLVVPLITARNTNTVGNSLAGFGMEADNGGVIGDFFADGNNLFGIGSDSIFFRVRTNHPLAFGTNNTVRMVLSNAGDLGVGVLAAAAKLEVRDTAEQLRLSFNATKFASFTVDTNHDLTITPSSTGQIILQPTTDSVDFFQVLDADGGTPVLNVDSTNGILFLNETSNSKMTSQGFTVRQDTGTSEVISTKNATINQPFTDRAEADTFGVLKMGGANGGVALEGFSAGSIGMFNTGYAGTEQTAKATSSLGAVSFLGRKSDGGTGFTQLSSNANLIVFRNDDEARWILSGGGEMHIIPGSDTSLSLIELHVTDTPTFAWDETENAFELTHGLHIDVATNAGAYRDDDLFRVTNYDNDGGAPQILMRFADENANDDLVFTRTTDTDPSDSTFYLRGSLGLGVTSPSTKLDIGAGAMEFEEMTAPAAGAANTARLFAQDNGAGKTQLAVRFNTGAIQIIATEP